MPHLITNRPRKLSLHKTESNALWSYVNALLYIGGGLLFIIGSVFFLPAVEDVYPRTGAYLFVIGSLFYLFVVCHDFIEVNYYWKSEKEHNYWLKLEYWVSIIYIIATVLFIVGSIYFLPSIHKTIAGSWCFIIGSVLFFIAAGINILQAEHESNQSLLFAKNSIAINFLAGSVIFTMASFPYLWNLDTQHDKIISGLYSGSWFIVGSVFFFIGGLICYKKAVIQEHLNPTKANKSFNFK